MLCEKSVQVVGHGDVVGTGKRAVGVVGMHRGRHQPETPQPETPHEEMTGHQSGGRKEVEVEILGEEVEEEAAAGVIESVIVKVDQQAQVVVVVVAPGEGEVMTGHRHETGRNPAEHPRQNASGRKMPHLVRNQEKDPQVENQMMVGQQSSVKEWRDDIIHARIMCRNWTVKKTFAIIELI